ncbi:tyrosyl-DNA phosphodiesterase 1-like protein [Phlyctochytrium arcticum]|nr:tyrosyl-DNA phosphodiesterase 1-like protein [Phlyctochytrium arcticum]
MKRNHIDPPIEEDKGQPPSPKRSKHTSDTGPGYDSDETEIADEESPTQQKEIYCSSGIHLVRVLDLPAAQNVWSKSLHDIFHDGELETMLQLNYMIELKWMMGHLPHQSRRIPITCVHGLRGSSRDGLRNEAKEFPNVKIITPDLPIPFGTHHTKAMILFYKNGTLRVIIHTANMISRDWRNKSQGLWISPLLSPKSTSPSTSCQFELDLLEYLSAYGPPLSSWRDRLATFDFRSCRAVIIGSVPGRHTGPAVHRWGHLKLRRVLAKVPVSEGATIACQFSSIGSLGTDDSWITKEFGASLRANRSLFGTQPDNIPIRLIFPTVSNVQNSLEGWAAGNSIPFDSKNWQKQQSYMRPRLTLWKAEKAGRERAMPHIKTYTRFTSDGRIDWFVLTSANLSKAAWGASEKNGKQLMIRSYELGVLVYPDLFKVDNDCTVTMKNVTYTMAPHIPLLDSPPGDRMSGREMVVPIRLPYDLPLTPYTATDEAWTWDVERREKDCLGMRRLGS